MCPPTVGATHLEFSDVASSGATNLTIKSGSSVFMALNVCNGIKIYKPILLNRNAFKQITATISASTDIASGAITTLLVICHQ